MVARCTPNSRMRSAALFRPEPRPSRISVFCSRPALCRSAVHAWTWSERRLHVAGRLGAALCTHGQDRGWIRKRAGSRALDITPEGRRAYHDRFHVELNEHP